MPTINIEDKDYTRPGNASATNFAVVVPGYIEKDGAKSGSKQYTTEFFKKYKDGIAEYSDLATFKEEVGITKNIVPEFKYAKLLSFAANTYDYSFKVTKDGEVSKTTKEGNIASGLPDNGASGDPAEHKDVNYIYNHNLSGHILVFPSDSTKAAALFKEYKNNTYKGRLCSIALYNENVPETVPVKDDLKLGKEIYSEVDHTTVSEGKTFNVNYYYQLTLIEDKPGQEATYDASAHYVVLLAYGSDAVATGSTEIAGYGTQIAAELLTIGYNIIFVGINQDHPEKMYAPETYEPLKDKSAYSFRFIISGFNDSNEYSNLQSVYGCIVDLANSRGDCIALLDVDEKNYYTLENGADQGTKVKVYKTYAQCVQAAIDGLTAVNGNKNSAIFTPAVIYGGLSSAPDYDKNVQLPASFHYLTCFYSALQKGYAEWYAAAGENRGVSDYSISKTTVDFGANVATILEPRSNLNTYSLTKAANVITKFKNTYLLWGNRTANAIGSELTAGNFLNVRQLVTTLKQELYAACKRFSFDPNSDTLWINFCNAIRPTLDRMKANEGLRDYKILKLKTNLKATFKARIRIIPIEAVEDFDILISLEDTFGTTELDVAESM